MRIGVFCSGGDAPGMNPCVRAIVRAAAAADHEVVGINRGYDGLLKEDFYINEEGKPVMRPRTVSGWSRYGGAFLRSSRSEEFRTDAGLDKAVALLNKHKFDALVPIGGDGTFRGAVALAQRWNGSIVGCPGTIDNDLVGTDYTIGFSTAVETAVEAVDKIRDTAESHERMFLIEVMGRHSGYIALFTAIASGAEAVCVPETCTDIDEIVRHLHVLKQRGKHSIMMIVAEGDERGGAEALNKQIQAAGCPFSTRVAILGHLQRGGRPNPDDRILATILGARAVQAIDEGATGVMAGLVSEQITLTPFPQTFAEHKPLPKDLLDVLAITAR
jgi:6-phosphofructokinase 1